MTVSTKKPPYRKPGPFDWEAWLSKTCDSIGPPRKAREDFERKNRASDKHNDHVTESMFLEAGSQQQG